MSKAVLLDEDGAVTQKASDRDGINERGCGIGLISNDDDRVFQRVVPRASEPLYSTRGPSVAIMGGLRELYTNWKSSMRGRVED